MKSTANLDFETKNEYMVTVMVEDSGTPHQNLTKSITIKITNVNEPPTMLSLTNTEVCIKYSPFSRIAWTVFCRKYVYLNCSF